MSETYTSNEFILTVILTSNNQKIESVNETENPNNNGLNMTW